MVYKSATVALPCFSVSENHDWGSPRTAPKVGCILSIGRQTWAKQKKQKLPDVLLTQLRFSVNMGSTEAAT